MPVTRPDQVLATFSMTGGTGAYTGPFTAVTGWQSPAVAGDGATVKVVAFAVTSTTNLTRTGQWEEYEGVYSSSGSGSITRVRFINSSTGSPINWTNPTTCGLLIGPLGEDIGPTVPQVLALTAPYLN